MTPPRRLRAAAACAVLALSALAGPARAGERVVLPIVAHVAQRDGASVVPEGFVAEQLARANAIFAPYGVQLALQATATLPAEHAALETRADRDALGARARRGAIDLFVVASLRDVDTPSELRRGVHWRSRVHPGARYVIVSAIAGPNVLAHELGHYLGNRAHSDVPGNLMSYVATDALPVLDRAQQRRMRAALAKSLASGELRALLE